MNCSLRKGRSYCRCWYCLPSSSSGRSPAAAPVGRGRTDIAAGRIGPADCCKSHIVHHIAAAGWHIVLPVGIAAGAVRTLLAGTVAAGTAAVTFDYVSKCFCGTARFLLQSASAHI